MIARLNCFANKNLEFPLLKMIPVLSLGLKFLEHKISYTGKSPIPAMVIDGLFLTSMLLNTSLFFLVFIPMQIPNVLVSSEALLINSSLTQGPLYNYLLPESLVHLLHGAH